MFRQAKTKGNTIDFRGIEQIIPRSECEEYAATIGYEFMFYGRSCEPEDVDPSSKSEDGTVSDYFWSEKETVLYQETGHILKYPSRQYCARCGEAMYASHSPKCSKN